MQFKHSLYGFLIGLILLNSFMVQAQTIASSAPTGGNCHAAFEADARNRMAIVSKKHQKMDDLRRKGAIGLFVGIFTGPIVYGGATGVIGYTVIRQALLKVPESEKIMELIRNQELRRLVKLTEKARKYDPTLSREQVQYMINEGMNNGALCPNGVLADYDQVKFYIFDQAYKSAKAKRDAGETLRYSDVTRTFSADKSCLREYLEVAFLNNEKKENVTNKAMKSLAGFFGAYFMFAGAHYVTLGELIPAGIRNGVFNGAALGMVGSAMTAGAAALQGNRAGRVVNQLTDGQRIGHARGWGKDLFQKLIDEAQAINPTLSPADAQGQVVSILNEGFETREFCKYKKLFKPKDIRSYVLNKIPRPAQAQPTASIDVNDSDLADENDFGGNVERSTSSSSVSSI